MHLSTHSPLCRLVEPNMLPIARTPTAMKRPNTSVLLAGCLIIAGCSSSPTSTPSPTPTQPATNSSTPSKTATVAAAPTEHATAISKPESKIEASQTMTTETTVAVEPVMPIKVTPEALALVERLTQAPDSQRHELSDTTSFPEAMLSLETGARAPKTESIDTSSLPPPEGLTADGSSTHLIVRDWTGLVLVPISTSLSKAYTSEVRLLKIEAHPLNDGRVRIWTRIQNLSTRTLPGQIACRFNMHNQPTATSPYFYELQVPPRGFRDVFFISPDGDLLTYTVLVRSEEMRLHN